MTFDPAISEYYNEGKEAERLFVGDGRLEFERTKELISRFLPQGSLDVLDVGGGPGMYSVWLQESHHRCELIDPVPLHVEQARAAGILAQEGDARSLRAPADSVDVVLLLGPLYHLPTGGDRAIALSEALRVLRPGGLLFAAAINRYAALLDLLINKDRMHKSGLPEVVERSIRDGVFDGTGGADVFTTAFFHLPDELSVEVEQAGFGSVRVFHVEGPGFLVPDLEERLDDPVRKDALLRSIRMIEEDASFTASSHLLAVARAPSA